MKQKNAPVLAGEVGGPYEPRDIEPIKIRDESGCPVETAVLQREWVQMKAHIAELEAQVPKVVKPILFAGDFVCECRWVVDEEGDRFRYCAGCGAKLDWSEA